MTGSFVIGVRGERPIMMRTFAAFASALLLAAATGCGSDSRADNPTRGRTMAQSPTVTKMSLTSDAFKDGQEIPPEYTCDGAGHRPELHWSEPPEGTKSFALVVEDPDAPGGTFRHWGIFDIAASTRSIGGTQAIGTEVRNDFGKKGYGGPCPPVGDGPHHYHFKLFALDTDRLGISMSSRVTDVERAAREHAIGQGELTGTYERKSTSNANSVNR
jgi:Raf kinase inhibitor-like YbhB/YbcL family protein